MLIQGIPPLLSHLQSGNLSAFAVNKFIFKIKIKLKNTFFISNHSSILDKVLTLYPVNLLPMLIFHSRTRLSLAIVQQRSLLGGAPTLRLQVQPVNFTLISHHAFQQFIYKLI
jgi:hypothetical protein